MNLAAPLNLLRKIITYIRLEEERVTFPESFRKELDYQSGRLLTFASLITLTWLTYIPIDIKLHPDKPIIIALRIGFPIVGTILFATRFIPFLRTRHNLMLTLYGAYMEYSVAVLTAATGGDTAYIGGYLFVMTLLAIAPLWRSAAWGILYSSLFIFFCVSYFYGTDFSSPHIRYSLNDLLCTAFIVSCFIYIMNSIRYTKWQKSKQAEESQLVIEEQKNQLEQQISIAGELHKALFPKGVPLIKEALISYRCLPMMDLGGDFIDIHYDEKEKILGLFVCDVSGHGVAGALFSSMVKITLNRWGETLTSPSATLFNLYEALSGKMGNHFVTAGVCCIHLKTGRIVYSSAGHFPALISRKDGSIDLVNAKGRLIAEGMPPNYEESEAYLKENEQLILYTDGVTECFDENNRMLGDENFFRVIKKYKDSNPEDISNNIFNELLVFNNYRNFSDDVTILIMKYLGYRE